MYLLVLFFPIFSFLVTILLARYLGSQLVIVINPLLIFLSLFSAFFCFYEVVLCGYSCTIPVFSWVQFGLLDFKFELLFDQLSVTMIVVVLFISFFVHFYSIEYMKNDPHLNRFLAYLTIFTIFMLIFVLSNNFIQLFLGWEGIGLASYLLINFWYTRTEANRSAMKAVIVNRFGDFGLYMSILLIFFLFKSTDFNIVFSLTYLIYNFNNYFVVFNYSFYFFSVISFFLFLAAAGKSAQLGLHIWLPDAMEGPTPVSALIHAATMVTAGIFLIIRCSPIFEYSKNFLIVIIFFGALTTLFASTIGIVQNDIKKIIAYSTCSQLGYMMFACGISNYLASFFHLFNHAFFKALLFLGAGSIIHSMFDEQDIRKYGGLLNFLPFSYASFLIGSLALTGFPFLSGFYSKDFIIESSYVNFTISGFFVYWLGSISVFFTTFYSFRLIYLIFFVDNKTRIPSRSLVTKIVDSPIIIAITLSILSLSSIFFGYLFSELFLGLGSDIFNNSIFINIEHSDMTIIEFIPIWIKLCPLFFSLTGFFIFILFYYSPQFTSFFFKDYKNHHLLLFYSFLSKKWYFDTIYYWFIVKPSLFVSYHVLFKLVDRGLLEFFGSLSIIRLVSILSIVVSKIQGGFLNLVIFMFLISFFFILLVFFFLLSLKALFILFFFYVTLHLINEKF